MEIIDISMEISEQMPVYKDREEKKPELKTLSTHQKDGVHETEISLNLHSGTHIDAPLHMIKQGATTEVYNWSHYITRARVLDLTDKEEKITSKDLKKVAPQEDEFLLFKTQNSFREDCTTDFVYLDVTGAQYLARRGIKGAGIDSLGIERAQPGHPTHEALLSQNIIILEGLRLADVQVGEYKLIFLPLKIAGVEAAPGRAILIRD